MKGYNSQLKKKQLMTTLIHFTVISLSKKKENTYVYKQDHLPTIVQKEDISFDLVQ